jgi:hypothetical protein
MCTLPLCTRIQPFENKVKKIFCVMKRRFFVDRGLAVWEGREEDNVKEQTMG